MCFIWFCVQYITPALVVKFKNQCRVFFPCHWCCNIFDAILCPQTAGIRGALQSRGKGASFVYFTNPRRKQGYLRRGLVLETPWIDRSQLASLTHSTDQIRQIFHGNDRRRSCSDRTVKPNSGSNPGESVSRQTKCRHLDQRLSVRVADSRHLRQPRPKQSEGSRNIPVRCGCVANVRAP